MKFNEAQKTALSHKTGPMMVLAGPGSGKTTVITHSRSRDSWGQESARQRSL